MTEYIVVYCNCPDEASAKQIAAKLIHAKLAAAVNLLPIMQSIYHWQDKIVEASEIQLLIKSKSQRFEQINQLIRSIHPYETPEIIATPIIAGDRQYLTWIDNTVT